jgi:hypothetical protein
VAAPTPADTPALSNAPANCLASIRPTRSLRCTWATCSNDVTVTARCAADSTRTCAAGVRPRSSYSGTVISSTDSR